MQGDGNDAADDKDETVLEELPDKVDLILKVGIKFSALLLKTQRQVVQMLTSLTVEDYDRPTNRQANLSDIFIRVFFSLFPKLHFYVGKSFFRKRGGFLCSTN